VNPTSADDDWTPARTMGVEDEFPVEELLANIERTAKAKPTSSYDRLLDALRAAGRIVKTNGAKTQAQCPAHDDTHPSMSIGPRRDGKGVVLKCGAGCETTDIVAALGLTMADLFDEPKLRNAWHPTRNYTYPGGRRVHRKPNKDFPQSGNKNDRSLFHADRIGDAETVYVCEGEKDVEVVESIDGVAVCSAMGAGKAHLADWSPLKNRHVIIVADRDDAGRKHAQQVAEILTGTVASVQIVEAAVGKDAADHIAAGKTLDELVAPSLLDKLSVTGDWLDAQQFDDLEYVVPDLLCEGLGYLGAPPKKGKSFLVGNIALAVASGGVTLGAIPVTQRPVLYLALEDGHRRLQDRFRKMNAGQALPADLTLIIRASPEEALAVIAEYLQRHRDTKPLVILDTLGKVKRGKRPNEDAYQADYAISSQLKGLADASPGSTLLVVHHTRKAAAEDFIETLSGTYGIAGAADYVIVIERRRGSDDAILSITGRDVLEAEYAVYADNGILWRLNGKNLAESRVMVEKVRAMSKLEQTHGRKSVELAKYVNDSRLVTPAEIAEEFDVSPKRASELLNRLANDGYVTKTGRGEFGGGEF
jgi:5S rRNA maturation endonuclease (ribonuclease M5)